MVIACTAGCPAPPSARCHEGARRTGGHSGTAPDAGATTVHHAHTHTLPHVHSGQQRSSSGGAVRWAHTNNSSSGGGRRTQRQWRAGLPRATATAAGHSVAVVTGVGVVVVLRAPMKWSPPAAAGCVEPSLRTSRVHGTAALAGWPAGLVGLQGLLAEAWLGSRARRAHSQQL